MNIEETLDAIAADAAHGDMVFPTNADIARRVQSLLDAPDCSLEQLSTLISAEPVLSARIVSIANSVAYNRSGRTTSDVRNAVAKLGFKTLRILVTAVLVRQMQGMSQSPEHRALAARLWEHTAHVAALARVIAQHVTKQDPDAAFFAGIVHEVAGFYLISRANRFPDLFKNRLVCWHGEGEAHIGRAVLRVLGVPENILAALETLWDGYLSIPPESLGDTLLLADQLAPVKSPLSELEGLVEQEAPVVLDVQIDDAMMSRILADSAEEVASLTAALKA